MIPGGIETNFAKLMSYSMEQGYRTIWITDKKHYEKASFRHIVEDERLEKVFMGFSKKLFGGLPSTLKFHKDEEVVMLTCHMDMFLLGERIRKKAKIEKFQHYLLVAHFTGKYDFPEQWFENGKLRNKTATYLKHVAKKLVENDCVRAFSLKHLEAFEKAYEVSIEDKTKKLWRGIDPVKEFPQDMVEKKAAERSRKFNIITCSRFEFPHKGYLVGLINKYAHIKKRHPQVSLTIVGYGEGEFELKREIAALEPSEREDIRFTGMLDSDRLEEEYKKAHLNIGVAGALIKGVKMGVPSLSCRHYSYSCETYGFWGDARLKSLCSESGEDIIPYIDQCIECSDQAYVDCAKKDFEIKRAADLENYHPDYFFEQQGNYRSTIDKKDFFKAVVLQICINMKKMKG